MARRGGTILLTVDQTSDIPLYEQLYQQLKHVIEAGTLKAGDKLPSIRSLCEELSISNTTVERVYLQLSVEGYVESVPRSGFKVKELDTEFFRVEPANVAKNTQPTPEPPHDSLRDECAAGRGAHYDFSFTDMASGSFPLRDWRHAADEVLYSPAAEILRRYPNEKPASELAEQLCPYLERHRGVHCRPEQIVIHTGTQPALASILADFDPTECSVAAEEPGYAGIRRVAAGMGFKVVPVPTDLGKELFFEALEAAKPKIVFTTPSHQFPTGAVMQLDARIELLKWAQANDAYIIEDDSCSEYRYNTKPIPSLQSLDRANRVIYLGNFSKVFSPSMRLAYTVLPPKLLAARYRRTESYTPAYPWITQATLAKFFELGYWERHLNRTIAGCQARHNELLLCLQREMGDKLTIGGINSGIHFYVTVHNGMTEAELLQSALAQGANVYSSSRYRFTRQPDEGVVMIGFSSIPLEDIAPGVAALKRAWFG